MIDLRLEDTIDLTAEETAEQTARDDRIVL